MKKKKAITIVYEGCHKCPNFDDEYYTYRQKCLDLNRKIENPDEIPEDCPLEDVEEGE